MAYDFSNPWRFLLTFHKPYKSLLSVYCNITGTNGSVGRVFIYLFIYLFFFFFFLHILAVILLHQHKFCIYKGIGKLQKPVTCETFALLALYQFLLCFVNILLESVD